MLKLSDAYERAADMMTEEERAEDIICAAGEQLGVILRYRSPSPVRDMTGELISPEGQWYCYDVATREWSKVAVGEIEALVGGTDDLIPGKPESRRWPVHGMLTMGEITSD
jgi:hypothetical protein